MGKPSNYKQLKRESKEQAYLQIWNIDVNVPLETDWLLKEEGGREGEK